MHTKAFVAAFVAVLMLPAGAPGKGKPVPMECPTDVAAALAATCPCDAQQNHGRYVSCVARFRNALRKAGCADRETLHSLVRCSARSTCGKVGRVVCCVPSTGVCSDPMPGDSLAQGACSNDHAHACNADADCTEAVGRLMADETKCTAAGGTSAGAGSVCTACTTTSTVPASSTTTTSLP
jgi:hypothetical protein